MPSGFWETPEMQVALASWHIGHVIRAYRGHRFHGPRDLPQEVVAECLGITQSQLSRVENGSPIQNIDRLIELARIFKIPGRYLWFKLPEEYLSTPVEDDVPTASTDVDLSVAQLSGDSLYEPLSRHVTQLAPPERDVQDGVLPVIINGRPVFLPLGGDAAATGWDIMSPPDRRSLLAYGLASAAVSALSLNKAVRHTVTPVAADRDSAPLTFPAPLSTSWAAATYDAVVDPVGAARRATTASDGGSDDVCALRRVVDRVMQVSLSSDYVELERSLPNLIGRTEAANMQVNDDDHLAALRLLSDVYAVVGWTLIKADNPVGAWMAAQRAVRAAEQADDVLRVAAATRCLAEVHMRAKNLEEATRTAFLAAVHLDTAPPTDSVTALSLRGAAMLSAAAASARRGDSREAYAALKAAAVCASDLGEDRSDLGTVFGPTNVAIHRVAVAVELGNAREAVRHIPTVQFDLMPKALTERRARFLIDVARSYAQLQDDTAAVQALIQAETIAPDELRHHRLTHELVLRLLARENRTSELRALADRCNLLN